MTCFEVQNAPSRLYLSIEATPDTKKCCELGPSSPWSCQKNQS